MLAKNNKKEAGENNKASLVATGIIQAWCICPIIVAFIYALVDGKYAAMDFVEKTTKHAVIFYLVAVVVAAFALLYSLYLVFSGLKSGEKKLPERIKCVAKTEPWLVMWVALLFWCLLAAVFADNKYVAFLGTQMKRDGWLSYCMYAAFMGLAFLIKEEKNKFRVFNTFIAVSDAMILIMMAAEWEIPVIEKMSNCYSAAIFMHPNHYGYYIGMGLMCSFGLFVCNVYQQIANKKMRLTKWGYFYFVSFIWLMYGLMVNDTFGVFLAVSVAIVIMLVLYKIKLKKIVWKVWAPIVISILIVGLSGTELIANSIGETVGTSFAEVISDFKMVADSATKNIDTQESVSQDNNSNDVNQAGSGRIILWKEAVKLIPKHPLLGVGEEGLTGDYAQKLYLDRPHNEYIQMAVFCGIPALILYLTGLLWLFINRCRNLKKLQMTTMMAIGVVVAYMISAFFGFTLFYTTPYMFIFLGLVAGSVAKDTDIQDAYVISSEEYNNRADISCFIRDNSKIIVASVTFSFMIGIFSPVDVYIANDSNYWFDLYNIAHILVLVFLALLTVMLAVGVAVRKNPVLEKIYYIFLVIMIACTYIQGSFIEVPYGPLNGENVDWDYYFAENVTSAVVWLAIALAILGIAYTYKYEKFSSVANIVMKCLLIVMVISGILSCCMSGALERKANKKATTKNYWTYSKNRNFNILVLDTYDSRVFSKYLNSDVASEVKEQFKDFTYFRDTLGAYTLTDYAINQIMTGERYIAQTSFGEYVEDAYNKSPLINELRDAGWSVNIYTDKLMPQREAADKIDNVAAVEIKVDNAWKLADVLYHFVMFKHAPTPLKRFFAIDFSEINNGTGKIISVDGKKITRNENAYYDPVIVNWENDIFYENSFCYDDYAEQNVFHMYHLQGIHAPRDLDVNYEKIENESDFYSLEDEGIVVNRIVSQWLENLKENGLYDNSIIMIMGDHASSMQSDDENFIQCPLLMIKGTDENHEFQITDLPMSYEDLNAMYDELLTGETAYGAAKAVVGALGVDTDRFPSYGIEKIAEVDSNADTYEKEVGRRRRMIFHTYEGMLGGDDMGTTGYELYTDYHAFSGTKIQATGNVY